MPEKKLLEKGAKTFESDVGHFCNTFKVRVVLCIVITYTVLRRNWEFQSTTLMNGDCLRIAHGGASMSSFTTEIYLVQSQMAIYLREEYEDIQRVIGCCNITDKIRTYVLTWNGMPPSW